MVVVWCGEVAIVVVVAVVWVEEVEWREVMVRGGVGWDGVGVLGWARGDIWSGETGYHKGY